MRDSDWLWNDSSGSSEGQSTYDNVTFVVIDGQLHMRSSHLPDQPFVPIDKDTCKPKEEYEPWTSEGNLLNFSKTDEESKEGNAETGFRYLRVTQMHYLNNELWIGVPYYASDYNSSIKGLVMEVWTRNDRHFSRT